MNSFSNTNEGNVIVSGRWQTVHPNLWNERFPNECSKFGQSPINIYTAETVYDEKLKDFVFHNFDLKLKWKMRFDGYSSIIQLFLYSRLYIIYN